MDVGCPTMFRQSFHKEKVFILDLPKCKSKTKTSTLNEDLNSKLWSSF